MVPSKWYSTQKEHWIAYVTEYIANRSQVLRGSGDTAEYVYNRSTDPKMIIWLAETAGVDGGTVREANAVLQYKLSSAARASLVRKMISWQSIEKVLWPDTNKQILIAKMASTRQDSERISRSTIPTTVFDLLDAIHQLPADDPVVNPNKWYLTQKEHWIGWLTEYHQPGAYGRSTNITRDAKYAYNHVVQPELLLYLIKASCVASDLVEATQNLSSSGRTMMQRSGEIRALVPWGTVAAALSRTIGQFAPSS